jgi:iron complex transport system permease protein
LLVAADTMARTIAAPAELPIGILTAAIGAPFFLWLLLRRQGGIALSITHISGARAVSACAT